MTKIFLSYRREDASGHAGRADQGASPTATASGMAEHILTRAWGRPPTDPEIVPSWVVLIDANRPLLVEPSNPDLILPGQLFTLPPAPAVRASGR